MFNALLFKNCRILFKISLRLIISTSCFNWQEIEHEDLTMNSLSKKLSGTSITINLLSISPSRSLVRKLKKNGQRNSVKDLIKAIQEGNKNSPCVVIPRSLDGRMQGNLLNSIALIFISQVAQRKIIPHLLFCQIWRWQDLKNHHELRSSSNCCYPR